MGLMSHSWLKGGGLQPNDWVRVLTRLEYITFNEESSAALMLGLSHPIDPQGNLGLYWKT